MDTHSVSKENTAKWTHSNYRDQLSTVDAATGNRVWVYPKKPKGKWHNRRGIVGYSLLAFLVLAPWIRINSHPLLLLDFINRKFVMFGQVFWPQDFFIFLIGLVTIIVFVFLFTSIFGRVWCGWTCPQTIFMELVFRKVEYFCEGDPANQKKLDKMEWNNEKLLRRGGKFVLFYLISFAISNIFLSYIVGSEQLIKIITGRPSEHIVGLIGINLFSGIFFSVYAYFREQVCTVICPYGRLQSVMVDNKTMVVAYDHQRGDNREKWGRNRSEDAGDCIDCHQCVDVCPTGIDIRNGIQLECVSCTACIDACDNVMTKIGKPEGLIRFASIETIENKTKFKLTTRSYVYSAICAVLVTGLVVILATRSDVQASILRTPGMSFIEVPDGRVANIYNFKILNKTFNQMPVELKLEDINGKINYAGRAITAPGNDYGEGVIKVEIAKKDLSSVSTPISIGVYTHGKKVQTVKTSFLGPGL
jgi:cytochrome c oxidase accessory protein FixG